MAEVTSIRDSAGKWLTNRLPSAMGALGIRAVGAISASIDTLCPVYHADGDRHSEPGDPPFKETGNLQAGLEHREKIDGDDFVVTIISNRAPSTKGGSEDVPIFLEFGTDKMAARPYMRPVMNRTEQLMPESLRQSLSSEATYAAAG